MLFSDTNLSHKTNILITLRDSCQYQQKYYCNKNYCMIHRDDKCKGVSGPRVIEFGKGSVITGILSEDNESVNSIFLKNEDEEWNSHTNFESKELTMEKVSPEIILKFISVEALGVFIDHLMLLKTKMSATRDMSKFSNQIINNVNTKR